MKASICGIYCIEVIAGNPEKIGWKYVGLAKDCIKRSKDHFYQLGRNRHHSPQLQNYYNRYGKGSLCFIILQECPKSELNFWEKWFIKSFDCRKSGFNSTDGGESPSEKIFRKCTLQNIYTNEIVTCNSISEFTERYGISNVSCISAVLNGRSNYTYDWFDPSHKWRPTFDTAISPEGKEYNKIFYIDRFCLEHGIKNRHNFLSMLYGDRKSCEGWVNPTCAKKKRINWNNLKLRGPDGKIYELENVQKFAKDHHINERGVYKILYKERKSYDGWALYEGEFLSKL